MEAPISVIILSVLYKSLFDILSSAVLGDGETVRLLKDNIAFLVGVILGVPVFISTCYMLNRRRRRTGSMDITPVTSESSKQKMSSAQDSR